MTDPRDHRVQVEGFPPFGQGWAPDHDDWQAQGARRRNLGCTAGAAGILRDDKIDPVFAHQRKIAFLREGPPCNDHVVLGKAGRRFWRVNEAQEIKVLRVGFERGKVQAADCEHDARRRAVERRDRARNVLDRGPLVTALGRPWRPCVGDQGYVGGRASRDGIRAHLPRERMGGVDHVSNVLCLQIGKEPVRAAKATDTLRQGLPDGARHASRKGYRGANPKRAQPVAEARGLGRPAQDQQVG